jgi:YD repeat-containing protein
MMRSIAYDARGNTASETRPAAVGVTTGYDGYVRLTSYTRTGDASQVNVYNGLDDRVTVTSGSTVRRYVYDADGRLLGEYGTSAADVKVENMVHDLLVIGGNGRHRLNQRTCHNDLTSMAFSDNIEQKDTSWERKWSGRQDRRPFWRSNH